tara:strand:- start:7 stop:1278 length:1272 start_codon:yes stop_codon:yes gene_type:complete
MSNRNALLLFHHPVSCNAPTIMDHVKSFSQYSKNCFTSINTLYEFPNILANYKFDLIVLHYSLFGSLPFRLPRLFSEFIQKQSKCIKIAFFQDEYQLCLERFRLIDELKISVVFSLLNEKYLYSVYDRCECVSHVFSTLTGYVSEDLRRKSFLFQKKFQDRSIDFGYRARELSFVMGKGAQEKTEIAINFKKFCTGKGYILDLNSSNNSRIYGDDWFKFVSNCKGMLGVEAGVSIFDINGDIIKECKSYLEKNINCTFDKIYNDLLHKYEYSDKNIYYRTISPRIFEAAAFKVCMILYEGQYNQIIQPYVHYIPLRKDFSNIDEVFNIFNDKKQRQKIVENAYDHIIGSNLFTYAKFIKGFDSIIDEFKFCGLPDQDFQKLNRNIAKKKNLYVLKFYLKKILRKFYFIRFFKYLNHNLLFFNK